MKIKGNIPSLEVNEEDEIEYVRYHINSSRSRSRDKGRKKKKTKKNNKKNK